jgi:PAS domain S-box-containing protein
MLSLSDAAAQAGALSERGGAVVAALLGALVAGALVALWLGRRQALERSAALERSISDCERLRELARDQESFLRNVIDTVPGFVCVKALEGRFLLANRVLADAYGTTVGEIVTKSDKDLNPDQAEVAAFLADDREVILEQRVKHVPVEKFTTRAGVTRWLQTVKVPLFDRDGTCSKLLAVAMDITERRRLEQELVQAQKLQAVGQLAGGVAHDFNNLLTAMMGAAETLHAEIAKERADLLPYCTMVQDAAQEAATLTQNLLSFSRRSPQNPIDFDVHEVVRRVVDLLTHSLDRRIAVATNLAPGPLPVRGDRGAIQNALLNLAINARDAMPEGGTLTFFSSRVTLSEEDRDAGSWDVAPGPHVELGVADTGIGMDAETRERVFEPFFTTKAENQGTGLGLAVVYGTVRGHRGKIVVQSEPGRGSIFKLYLPEGTGAKEPEGEAFDVVRGTGRVLLVDDERLVRAIAAKMLGDLGYDVRQACDGEDAVRAFIQAGGTFDLVILDLSMPGYGGAAAFRRMRQVRPHARILLTSGFSPEGEVAALLDAGAVGFLPKPFRRRALAAAVRAALSNGAGTALKA